MGHAIQHYIFDEDRDRGEIEGVANQDAIYNSDSRSELPGTIRFIEGEIYEDEEEAEKAIEKLDKGWYDQLAVKFYYYEPVKDTKAIKNLINRIDKAEQDILDYKDKNAINKRKSKLVGCTNCESRINKDYISDNGYNWNECPLCNTDLSSNTVKQSLLNKEERLDKMGQDLKELRRQNAKKGKKSVKWLVKTEYHV